MANPNPEIWGTPETWQNSKYRTTYATSAPAELKAIKPQIADFGSGDGSLYAGNLHGKTPINSMIDETICTCGQDPINSFFGKIGLFYNYQNVDNNKIPNTIIENNTPINWFLYDGYYNGGGGYDNSGNYHCRDRQNAAQRWKPEMVMTNNTNGCINPFVYYEIRTFLFQVVVATINGYDSFGYPVMDWKTAYDWKTNYPTRKICDIRLQNYSYLSNTDTTITYRGVIEGDTLTMNGIGLLLETSDDYSENVIDYANMNNGKWSMYSLIGVCNRGWYIGDCFYMPAFNMFDNQVYKAVAISGQTEHGWGVWTEIPYSAENYEKIMQGVACFGILFTDTGEFTFRIDGNDDNLCVPVIDENGIAHGEYTRGAANLDNDFLTLDSIRDKNYDPNIPVDPNVYSDSTSFNNVSFINAFTRRYILNASQVGQLASELWNANAAKDPNETMNEFVLDEYLTNNPIDTIVSLKYFPCTFTDVAPAVVYLGKYQTNIAATGLGTSVRIIDFAPINVFRHFNDFRDFEPHTQISVYIPFCGTVTIPTAECMGHYVSIKLAIDTATGAATGFVIVSKSGAGGICIATATGTAAIDIPVSGLQSANLQQAIFNATANWTQTQISNAKITSGIMQAIGGKLGTIAKGFGKNTPSIAGAISAVKGGPLGLAAYGANSLDPIKAMYSGMETEVENAKSEYALQHIEMPMRLIGSASPTLATVIELQCRLIIYRPITDENALASYADTVGFACLKSGTVSQFSGYTIGTIDVKGINATEQEKAAIAASFASGVYL